MVDGADDGSAAVDMPDETEHDEDGGGGTGKNRYFQFFSSKFSFSDLMIIIGIFGSRNLPYVVLHISRSMNDSYIEVAFIQIANGKKGRRTRRHWRRQQRRRNTFVQSTFKPSTAEKQQKTRKRGQGKIDKEM